MKETNNFELQIKELEKIVNDLENGEVNLDDAIEKFSKAMNLAKSLGEKLNQASDKVNKILAENGNLEDFTIENDNQ